MEIEASFWQVSLSLWRIFIFGALGYFKLGVLLEGLRRLMSYKSALHVLATFTEKVVPVHTHIALFWIPSISETKLVIIKLTKKAAVKLFDHTPITYLSTSLASCNLKNGFRCFVPHIIRTWASEDFFQVGPKSGQIWVFSLETKKTTIFA